MDKVSLLVAALLVLAWPASAQTVTDGYTLKQGGVIYAYGHRRSGSEASLSGRLASRQFGSEQAKALTAGRSIVCQEKDRDRYGRKVAICRAPSEDLGAILVREGLAWALVRYSSDYVGQETKAKTDRLGVHAHDCVPAWERRARQRPKEESQSMQIPNEHAALHFEVGLAITQWSKVEWDLHVFTAHCFNGRKGAYGRHFLRSLLLYR